MKRFLKYFFILGIIIIGIYGFWSWLQYKGASVIKKTTFAIMNELQKRSTLETANQIITKTIEGQEQLLSLMPTLGIDQIISSALFSKNMSLKVQGIVRAGYSLTSLTTGDIVVTRDGTVTLFLGPPHIFGVELTGELQTSQLGITTPTEIALEKRLREKAREHIIQEALSGGILQEAKNNAERLLQELFLRANIQIKNVNIQETKRNETK